MVVPHCQEKACILRAVLALEVREVEGCLRKWPYMFENLGVNPLDTFHTELPSLPEDVGTKKQTHK